MKSVDVKGKQSALGIGASYSSGTHENQELVNYANLKLA